MTVRPCDQQPTRQPRQRITRTPQHDPATTDSSSTSTRRKINNLSTHPRITIRRAAAGGRSEVTS